VYVDEFGAIATRFFVSLLSEGRKFGISLVLANQFQNQIQDETIREAIFGNVGTMVSFRTGHDDAVRLAHEFCPGPAPRDFVSLPNWRAYTRACVLAGDVRREAPRAAASAGGQLSVGANRGKPPLRRRPGTAPRDTALPVRTLGHGLAGRSRVSL
jgi:hypothetical protein